MVPPVLSVARWGLGVVPAVPPVQWGEGRASVVRELFIRGSATGATGEWFRES